MIKSSIHIHGECPVAILIGPPAAGKSMIVMSLIEYLYEVHSMLFTVDSRCKDFTDQPNFPFSNIEDRDCIEHIKYADRCKELQNILTANVHHHNNKKALLGTYEEFLIEVRVPQNNRPILRILDAPGEYYLHPAHQPLDRKLATILRKDRLGNDQQYPVYFVILLNLHGYNLRHSDASGEYEDQIISILKNGYNSKRGDRIVFLYNKADLSNDSVKDLLQQEYPKLKSLLSPKRLFFKRKLYHGPLEYVSGDFHVDPDENDIIPVQLYDSVARSRQSAANLWKYLS